MSTETKTENFLDPRLDSQSAYALKNARSLFDRSDPLPSQYVGISDQRQLGMDQIMDITRRREDSIAAGAAIPEWQKTLQGGYLNANPYIDDIVRRASNQAAGSQVGGYATGGRFGSGAMANAIADSSAKTAENLYGTNYQNERNRMMQALGQSGAMDQLQFADRRREYADAGRVMGVGSQYEADQLSQAQEAMRQYMNPYMQQQMFEASLASNPLNNAGTTIESRGFDWGGAMLGLM
jgi:hypothetical protein